MRKPSIPAIDLTGQRFGYLEVLRREGAQRRYAAWRCRCACGQECVVRSDRLKKGLKKACNIGGHFFMPIRMTSPGITTVCPNEYKTWERMLARCAGRELKDRRNYKNRGITVCEQWKSFSQFVSDMGPKPTAKHSIERIDNNGNYEPGNCRWATSEEQSRNRSNTVFVEYKGERRLLMDVVADHGVTRGIVYGRLKLGWTLERALFEPLHTKKNKAKPS